MNKTRTESRNITIINLELSIVRDLELLNPRIHHLGLGNLPDLRQYSIPLLSHHISDPHVVNFRQQNAFHNRPAFVILDVTCPDRSRQGNLLGKTLFPKVPDCIVVGISEEVHHRRVRGPNVVFEMIHEHTTVTLKCRNLAIRRRVESNMC